jgi:DNA-binding response OmpR family regulator
LTSVWGPAFAGSPNVVDVYVGYVRNKLSAACGNAVLLETVRGVGYRLRTEAKTKSSPVASS